MGDRTRQGLKRFQIEIFPKRRHHYEQLASSQSPRAVFLTCSDSRIHLELLTGSEPGEIFVERTRGNFGSPGRMNYTVVGDAGCRGAAERTARGATARAAMASNCGEG